MPSLHAQTFTVWRGAEVRTTLAPVTTHLVTGAQGYIGRYLTRELMSRRADATVVGIGRSVRDGVSLGGYAYERADVLDGAGLRALLDRHRPECIFHLAAAPRSGSGATITQTNVLGTVRLLDAIVTIDGYRPRVVLASSDGVYGVLDDNQLPASESAPCVPVDMHGASKLAAEHMSRIIGERHGVCVMVARIFTVCGPDAAIHLGDLGTTRDLIDVRDVASALAIIGEQGSCGETYNVSSGPMTTDSTPPGVSNASRHYGDVTRLHKLGFVQQYHIESGRAPHQSPEHT